MRCDMETIGPITSPKLPGEVWYLHTCKVCRQSRRGKTKTYYRACPGVPKSPVNPLLPCEHRGDELRLVGCEPCGASVKLKVFSCSKFGECTVSKPAKGVAGLCETCPEYSIRVSPSSTNWAYGVTTVPLRFDNYLQQTLASLARAGFPEPRLFVDGADKLPVGLSDYAATFRSPAVKAYGNWILSAYELYVRNPQAERYAIFQDDISLYPNLRVYLDSCKYPDHGYWNLCTYPSTDKSGVRGWYLSEQNGRGAQGLVFSNEALRVLLGSSYLVDRPKAQNGHRNIDGGVVTAMKQAGWKEYVHGPSLVGHIGLLSAIGNKPQPEIKSFRGESFDALQLVGV